MSSKEEDSIDEEVERNDLMAQFMSGDSSVCTSFNKAKLKDLEDLIKDFSVSLSGGSDVSIPLFGLGTWLSRENAAKEAVAHSLKIGYRLIDTAQLYENENEVGDAIKESKEKREDIYVVTKLGSAKHGAESSRLALKESLKKMNLKYVDLFLIHTPKGGKVVETWKTMLELKKEGLARSVGVSNFGVEQLEGLRKLGLEMPSVNQIELHPWLQQKKTRAYMEKHGIACMGYCPLARCKQFGKNGVLSKIAKDKGKSEAQICIRWSLQEGVITIPKSTNKKRIEENADVFAWSLSSKEMDAISKIDCGFKASGSVNSMDLEWDSVK